MIEFHPASERGHAEHGWLQTWHSFSFSDYYNPQRMGFGALRVLNEDIVEPGQGFGMHGHDNMEIVTIVLKGALEHKDSMGSRGVICPGDVQRMSAGTGVRHSEFNSSDKDPVHLLQIWVHPNQRNIPPSYEQKSFSFKPNEWTIVAAGKKNADHLYLQQDAAFVIGGFEGGKSISYSKLYPKNHVFVFLIEGAAKIGKLTLGPSDAAALDEKEPVDLHFKTQSRALIIEIPALP